MITNEYVTHPNGTCIYGWPYVNGSNIQPLYCGHAAQYADYSHGARLVSPDVTLDGQPARLDDVLRDAALAYLLSSEGPIPVPRVPLPPALESGSGADPWTPRSSG